MFLLLLSCQSNNIYESQFDGPNNAFVLDDSKYYNNPVAFVTNQFSSKISPLDVKFEIPLSDQSAAPFLRTQGISAGLRRQLGDVVVYEKELEEKSHMVQIFTNDFFSKSLLMIPYIYVKEGTSYYPFPTYEPAFTITEGDINDYNDSTKNVISTEDFSILDINSAEATTEVWTFIYEESIDGFIVEGSYSGRQSGFAYLGSEYTSDNGGIQVYLSSDLQTNEPIYLEVNTGIIEHQLSGIPLSFSKHPTRPIIAVAMKKDAMSGNADNTTEVISDNDTGAVQNQDDIEQQTETIQDEYDYWITFFNLDHQREVLTIYPDKSVAFDNLNWNIDKEQTSSTLFFPDNNNPILHQLTITDTILDEYENRPETFVIELSKDNSDFVNENLDWSEFTSPEQLTHITIADLSSNQSELDTFEPKYKNLFAGTNRGYLYLFDLQNHEWKHINPNSSESKGINLNSPITGLATTRDSFYFPTVNNFGGRDNDLGVVATTFDGSIYLIKAKDGCIGTISGGPSIEEVSSYNNDSATFSDRGASSNPTLYDAQGNGDRIIVNQCGGVAKTENWTVQYQENDGNWLVEGSVSGIQEERVFTNQRYQSDSGEISFTILSGTRPETDGDTFSFSTEANLLSFDRITNNSGQIESIQIPSQPKTFEYTIGESDGAWDPILKKQGVIIPLVNSNIVIRIDIEDWEIDAVWN